MTAEPLHSARRPDLQFFTGAFAIFRGVGFLWRTPSSWPWAAVPVALCTLLCIGAIAGAVHYVPLGVDALWPELADSLGGFGAGMVRFLSVAAAAVLGVLVATFVTPPLSAPALEHLVRLRERELGVAPRPAAGLFREFWCALQAQLIALAVTGPLLVVLWLLTWLFPPVAIVTVPLELFVLALLLAWSLLDYPLSLRGIGVSDRLRLMRAGAASVLGFGSALALLFAVPFLPLLLLPAAVAAAAEIGVELERLERARKK